MKLKDLISDAETVRKTNDEVSAKAGNAVENYILNPTITIKELCDVVAEQYNDERRSNSGQISIWQILNIAKQAILKRESKPDAE